MKWSLEPATGGRGTWLVGRDDSQVDVIAPPGTAIPSAETGGTGMGSCELGWWQASWDRRRHVCLNLDRDAPDGRVTLIGTREVLQLVGLRLRSAVRALLEDRLAQLEGAGRCTAPSQGPSDIVATMWLRSELAGEFRVERL